MGNDDVKQLLGIISHAQLKHRKKHPEKVFKDTWHGTSGGFQVKATKRVEKKHSDKAPERIKQASESNKDKGLWDSIAQHTMSAAGNVVHPIIDILSRISYGNANANTALGSNDLSYKGEKRYSLKNADTVEERFEALIKGTGQQLKRNSLELARDVTDPGIFKKAGSEWLKGFKGEKGHKYGLSKSIEMQQKKTGNISPFAETKAQRAILGFTGDVLADPTTFVGAGFVTKPLKKLAEHTVDKELAEGLAKLGIKHEGTDILMTADDFGKILGGVEHPNTIPKGLTRKQKKRYSIEHTVRGRDAFRRGVDSAAQTNRKLTMMEHVLKNIPEIDSAASRAAIKADPKISVLSERIAETQKALTDAVNDTGVGALKSYVAMHDEANTAKSIMRTNEAAAPHPDKKFIGGEHSNLLDDAIQVGELKRLTDKVGKAKIAEHNAGAKPHLAERRKARAEQAGHEADIEEIIGKWSFGDPVTARTKILDIIKEAEHIADNDPGVITNRARGGTLGRKMKAEKSDFVRGTYDTERKRVFAKVDVQRARILHSLLEHHAEGVDPLEHMPEAKAVVEKIDARRAELRDAIDKDPGTVIKSLKAELKALDKRRAEEVFSKNESQRFDEGKRIDARRDEIEKILKDEENPAELAQKAELKKELANLDKERASINTQANIKNIDARRREIKDALKKQETNPVSSVENLESPHEIVEGKEVTPSHTIDSEATTSSGGSTRDLKNELKGLDKERADLILEGLRTSEIGHLEAPDEVMEMFANGASTEDVHQAVLSGKIKGEWADRFVDTMKDRESSSLVARVEERKEARRRFLKNYFSDDYSLHDLPPHLQDMYVKEAGKKPKQKITIDEEPVLKSERDKLTPYVNDADRKKAESYNKWQAEITEAENKERLKKYDLNEEIGTRLDPKKNQAVKDDAIPISPDDPFSALGLTVKVREDNVAAYGSMSPSHIVEVFEKGNPNPVGHLWFDKSDGEVHSISVKPELQRKGLASGMMQYAEKLAKEKGLKSPKHSENLTGAGKAWKAATETRTMHGSEHISKRANKRAKGNKPDHRIHQVHPPVYKRPEWFAFDRMFQNEHKMSPDAATIQLQKAAGDYIQIGGRGNRPITRLEFPDYIRQHPEKMGPSGIGVTLKFPGRDGTSISYAEFKDRFGDWSMHGDYKVLSKERQREWTGIVSDWLRVTPTDEADKQLRGGFEGALEKQRDARKKALQAEFNTGIPKHELDKMSKDEKNKLLENGDLTGHFSTSEIVEMNKGAREDAVKAVNEEWGKRGNANLASVVSDEPIILGRSAAAENKLEEVHETTMHILEDNYNQAVIAAKGEYKAFNEAIRSSDEKAAAAVGLQNKLAQLHAEMKQAEHAHSVAYHNAVETQKIMVKRFKEEMLLTAVDTSARTGRNAIRISLGGRALVEVPTGDAMFRAVEKLYETRIIGTSMKAWSKAFKPASSLTSAINKARMMTQGRTADLIKTHVLELKKTFGDIAPKTRIAHFNDFRKGKPIVNPVGHKIKSEFDAMVPYLDGSMVIGEDMQLTHMDVNAYLPREFQLVHPQGISQKIVIRDGNDIVKHMRNMPANADPMEAVWSLRVAADHAQSMHGLKDNLGVTFGVKRELNQNKQFSKTPLPFSQMSEQGKLIEQLHDAHGYVTVKEIGQHYYFEPEIAKEITRLFEIMKPGNPHDLVKLYDKAQHAWKASVTIYNPGYYTRNGIGEVLMGVFDGLVNPAYYTAASRVMTHSNPDATKAALKELDPWAAHIKSRPTGSAKIATLKNGTKISVEDADVLYAAAGLKSGFVSTEFDHLFPAAGSLRASGPGQVASRTNDAVRTAGEKYEDYFRMAHFIYRLESAPRGIAAKGPQHAADWAAEHVRKYHFDYSDFTPLEKALMVRVFPFYKWTRKAMPLMAGMLFTKPGMPLLYPKAMQNLSYATGGTDPLQDDNGFLPNYATDPKTGKSIVPDWLQGMMAYPVGEGDAEGNQNYMNIANPVLDTYKMAGNPASTITDMASPFLKNPAEQFLMAGNDEKKGFMGRGHTIGPDFSFDLDTKGKKIKNATQTTPLGSLLTKIAEARGIKGTSYRGSEMPTDDPLGEPGKGPGGIPNMDEVLASFLTGIGTYENNKERQRQQAKYGKQ